MNEIMDWNVCLAEHVKNVDIDVNKITSIQKMCLIRLRLVNAAILDDETASIIATDYYEIIKELLIALLLKNGLKSDNHECLISFFKSTFPKYVYEADIIHQLKNARNRISYDAIFVKKDYIIMNKLEFEHIINLLMELLEK